MLLYSATVQQKVTGNLLRRQEVTKHQVLVRWREISIKNKIVKMMVMKRVLSKFRRGVRQHIREKTEAAKRAWVRYRLLMTWKTLVHNVYKHKKKRLQEQANPNRAAKFKVYS